MNKSADGKNGEHRALATEEPNIVRGSRTQLQDDTCPFCAKTDIIRVTDCYDIYQKKICELWYCNECSGFFPEMIVVATPVIAAGPGENRKETSDSEKRRAPRFPVQFVVQVDFNSVPSKGAPGLSGAPGGSAGSGSGSGSGISGRFLKPKPKLSEPIVAMVLDAGLGGLCFRYPEFVEEGREGKMRISLPSVARSFSALAKVVRSTKLPDGSFGLGVQFIDVEAEYRDALKRYVAID